MKCNGAKCGYSTLFIISFTVYNGALFPIISCDARFNPLHTLDTLLSVCNIQAAVETSPTHA